MLKISVAPSSLPSEESAFASGTGSPSVDSPSVMLMTIGGNPFGMLGHPALHHLGGHLERGAHRRAARVRGLEPERELHRLLHQPAGAVVHLLRAVLDANRVVGELADRDQVLARQRTVERRLHHGVLPYPITAMWK